MNRMDLRLKTDRRTTIKWIGGALFCMFTIGSLSRFLIQSSRRSLWSGHSSDWLVWSTSFGASPSLANGYLVASNVTSGQMIEVHAPFIAHSFTQDPRKPSRFVALPQNGESGVLVDFATRRVIQKFHPKKNHTFYGHASYVEEGKYLLTSESDLVNRTGRLIVRDSTTFELVREVDTYGTYPHDCKITPNGKAVVVTNEGVLRLPDGKNEFPKDYTPGNLESSVVTLDWRTGKLLHKYTSPVPNLCLAHIDLDSRGKPVVSSSPGEVIAGKESQYAGLGLVLVPGSSSTLILPSSDESTIQEMKGQALSICLNEAAGVVGAASPIANLITFWDFKRAEFIKSISLKQPLGICVTSNSEYFVVITKSGDLFRIHSKTLEVESGVIRQNKSEVGSHLLLTTIQGKEFA